MDASDPLWQSPAVVHAAAAGQFGTLIRLTRTAQHLSLTQLGERLNYSASTLSRIENGHRKLADVTELRVFADTLGIPAHLFGLTTPSTSGAASPATFPAPTTVGGSREGGDDVERRQLLAGLVALTGAALLGRTARPADAPPEPYLPPLISGGHYAAARPASVPVLRGRLAAVRTTYDDCRYHDLAVDLPAVIATAQVSLDETVGARREQTAAVLGDAYSLASDLCSRLHDDALAWVTAERARTYAQLSGNPASIAEAARMASIALRRNKHHDTAVDLLTSTALDLGADTGNPSPQHLAAYGALLCTASYTAAQHNDRHQALELIDEAQTAAARLGDVHVPGSSFSAANATIYRIGVHTALGDPGTALDHARTITLAGLPTSERQARFCVDTARAWQRFGSSTNSVNALRVAEQFAPEELRRSSVRDLITSLLETPGRTPAGLRALASRCGAVA